MTVQEDIAAERRRQVDVEGWTPEHDDSHHNGELLAAAQAYFHHATHRADAASLGHSYVTKAAPPGWPWELKWWKPKEPRRDLIRSGALAKAEEERLTRIFHRRQYRRYEAPFRGPTRFRRGGEFRELKSPGPHWTKERIRQAKDLQEQVIAEIKRLDAAAATGCADGND